MSSAGRTVAQPARAAKQTKTERAASGRTPLAERRARHRATDERTLIAAAEQVFGQHGYTNSQMREIAAVAGFSVGGVYQFFEGKDELLLAVVETLRRDHEAAIGPAEASGTFEERLLAFTKASIVFFAERRAFLITLMTERGAFAGAFKDRVAKVTDRFKRGRRAHVIEIMRAGIEERRLRYDDVELLTSAYLGILSQCNVDAHTGHAPAVPPAETLVSLFMFGAGSLQGAGRSRG